MWTSHECELYTNLRTFALEIWLNKLSKGMLQTFWKYWLKFKTTHCMVGISGNSEPSWFTAFRILALQPIFLCHVLMSLYVLYYLLPMHCPQFMVFICSPMRANLHYWCLCADPHCLASCVTPNLRSINIIDSSKDEFEATINTTFFLKGKKIWNSLF